MQIGCHSIFTHNEIIEASQIQNSLPAGNVNAIASDASYRRLQRNLPSVLFRSHFSCGRDSHVTANSMFQAQRIGVGSLHVTMGGGAIKQGIHCPNFFLGVETAAVKRSQSELGELGGGAVTVSVRLLKYNFAHCIRALPSLNFSHCTVFAFPIICWVVGRSTTIANSHVPGHTPCCKAEYPYMAAYGRIWDDTVAHVDVVF